MPQIDNFLRLMNVRGASDLHFAVGNPPVLRVSGAMEAIRYKTLSDNDFEIMLGEITPPALWERYKNTGDLDFAYETPGLARFRVNLFRQERGPAAVFRIIPTRLFTLDQLGMPRILERLTMYPSGLALVTGPTGSGKSTTLSAIVDLINTERQVHILTIEDPIEFVHPPKNALITQREVGSSAIDFAEALRAGLREDPDIILVGEMRDLETVQLALHAAGTGLLVFGTLHTNNAAKTIDRITSVFPADEQEGARAMVADCLVGVVSQQLLRRKEGGRVAALEIMFGSPAMATLIRDGKTHQLPNLIMQGKSRGMVTMDQSLIDLVKDGIVDPEEAYGKAVYKSDFRFKVLEELNVRVGITDEDPAESERAMQQLTGAKA